MSRSLGLPPGLTGDPQLVRISPRSAAASRRECPAHLAAKAHPALFAEVSVSKGRHALETFPLASVQARLDDLEFSDTTRKNRSMRLHPGSARYVDHAVRHYHPYLNHWDDPELRPVRHHWVAQASGERTWEMFTWGRRYASVDGTLREFRFLRMGTVDTATRSHEPSAAEIAIAAHTTAIGLPASWPSPRKWPQPFTPIGPSPSPGQIQRVRVVEIGLLDGSCNVLFDGEPRQAKAQYDEHGRPVHAKIVAGGTPIPGASCADCKALMTCEERISSPGLLGIPASRAPLRTVSVSDLRYHRQCPAQYHLRTLRLPKDQEYGAKHRRGKAVHAWLEETHRAAAVHGRPCTPREAPDGPESWSEPEWVLPPEEACLGARMLAGHTEVCPFTGTITDVCPEPDLAFYDEHANAVVIAKPDLLFYEDGAPVWRETKTLRSGRVSRRNVFRRYPQLALALLILHGRHLKGEQEGARVELEVLYPNCMPTLVTLHPDEPEDVEEAREELHALTRAWHSDTAYPPRPEKAACGSCPVSRWCPDSVSAEEG